MRSPLRFLRALGLVPLLVLQGCGKDDAVPVAPGATTPSSQLTGVYAGGFDGGLVSVSIAAGLLAPARRGASLAPAAADTIAAVFVVLSPEAGGVVNLTGTYDAVSDSLHCAGHGYDFLGRYDPSPPLPILEGRYTGPNGDGTFACAVDSASTVRLFCGRFESGTGPAGRWNVAVATHGLAGAATPDGNATGRSFSGTVTGSGATRSLAFSSGDTFTGSGTWDVAGDRMTGRWAAPADSGTWAADRCFPGDAGSN